MISLAVVVLFCATITGVRAQSVTTGAITGTVVDSQTGAPIANVTVTAAAATETRSTTTNARGFYTLQALFPDTYTVTFSASGYQNASFAGTTVQQQLTVTVNGRLNKEGLKTIASTSANGSSNLVKPDVTSDEYTVAGDQLNAATLGNAMHKTLYQYIQTVPGITASGYEAQPRIHGGSIVDEQYEFDGIPIKDRMTGFFTTNLSSVGIGNVEVYTGGLSASDAASGLGVINTVVKTGTYPAFGDITYGTAIDDSNLVDYTAEYGGATPDHRWSWYMGADLTNAGNAFASGLTYPALLIEGDNGPGPVKTTDLLGNFHYHPNQKNDFQFLIQNGLGDFVFSYLMQRQPGEPQPLTAVPCPGYVVNSTTATGASGGLAPNGQTCPAGLYFGTANTQTGGGNIWHHYSGIGKLQWNHIINTNSFFSLRFAENYNEYIFDQPIVEANIPSIENSADFAIPYCPALPYTPGSPIELSNPPPPAPGQTAQKPRLCTQQDNWFSTGYEGDRRSEMWLGSLDYTDQIGESTLLKAGVSNEYDQNLDNSYFTFYFNGDGSWPGINSESTYPDHIAAAYVTPSFSLHKWLLAPGLLYQRMNYDYPGGPYSVGIWNPTFAATYTAGPKDVIRGSYTDSTSFIGTAYVYQVGSSVYDPGSHLFSADPTLIHSADLMWEHQIDSATTFKFGPNVFVESNAFFLYRPIISISSAGAVTYGPQQASNGGYRQSFGAELAINHDDKRTTGTSWWLSSTYDNYWTNITSSLTGSYNGAGLPGYLGRIRNTGDPFISATLTADLHQNGFHFIPFIYYQGPSPYNVGVCGTTPPYGSCNGSSGSTVKNLAPTSFSNGYWFVNATIAKSFGPDQRFTVGLQATNVLNNLNATTPCYTGQLQNTPQLGAGCNPYFPLGNYSLTPNTYTYQNYSQTPRQVQLFISTKLPN